MLKGRSILAGLLVLLSFGAVAVVQTWPLATRLQSAFTADASGDTSVYVWNTWVFGHEVLVNKNTPFQTDTLPGFGGPVDLSLHNYTVFADVVAMALQPWLGIIGAFNVVFLLNFALTGFCTYLLIRHLPHTADAGVGVAWLAALLFSCSPFIVGRGNGHFSVASAAALPLFVMFFHRTLERRHVRDALAAGACIAWAAYSDLYFAVYCVLLALALLLAHVVDVRPAPRPIARNAPRWLDLVIVVAAATIVLLYFATDGSLRLGPVIVSMRTFYTPVMILTVLVAIRVWFVWRPKATWSIPAIRPYLAPAFAMVAAGIACLSPLLYSLAIRAAEGEMVAAPVLWRSSAPGVDLLAFLLPNPNHPLAPGSLVQWLKGQPGEGAASIPLVSLAVIAVAWFNGHRPHRGWFAMSLAFAWIALGPFVRIAGLETLMPTPWTFMRYLPIIGEARMPGRLSVLVILCVTVLFAAALPHVIRGRRAWFAAVSGLLAFELLAAPRVLFPADIPEVVHTVAADPRDVRVLPIPFGIRDGLHTHGNFNPVAMYFQATHAKPLVGGYLSRISDTRQTLFLTHPFMGALIQLSEGKDLTPDARAGAAAAASDFLRESGVGWVLIDEHTAQADLQTFVVDTLRLEPRGRSGRWALYAPATGGGAADVETGNED